MECHLNVTCLVVLVISISNVSNGYVIFFFLHKSHLMSISRLCVSIDVHFFVGASFCASNVKTLSKTHTAKAPLDPR